MTVSIGKATLGIRPRMMAGLEINGRLPQVRNGKEIPGTTSLLAGAAINGRLHQALSGRGILGTISPPRVNPGAEMIGPLPQARSGKEIRGIVRTTRNVQARRGISVVISTPNAAFTRSNRFARTSVAT